MALQARKRENEHSCTSRLWRTSGETLLSPWPFHHLKAMAFILLYFMEWMHKDLFAYSKKCMVICWCNIMLLHLKKWCVKITYYITGSTCGQYEASPVISLATQASKNFDPFQEKYYMEWTFIESQNFTWSCKKQQMTIKAGKTLISWYYCAIGIFFPCSWNKQIILDSYKAKSFSFFFCVFMDLDFIVVHKNPRKGNSCNICPSWHYA